MSDDIKRIQKNVAKMRAQNAPESDIVSYLKMENMTPTQYVERIGATPAAPVAPAPKSEYPGNFARSVANGLLLGFGDEAEAGLRAAVGQGSYEGIRDQIRAGMKQYEAQSPAANAAGEIVGGVLPLIGSLAAAPFTGGASTAGTAAAGTRLAAAAPTLGRQILRGMGVGAGTGFVSGVGNSEGSVGDQLTGGAKGATVGTVVGGAVPGVMAAGRAVVEKGRDVLGRTGESAVRKADELIMKSMERDGLTPAGIADRAKQNATLGAKPETIADLGGANIRGRAAAAANVPGPTKENAQTILTERMRGQSERIIGDMERSMGEKLENTNKLVSDILDQRSKAAAPMYEAAYAKMPIVNDNAINEMLNKPQFREAYARAQRIADLEGRKLPEIYRLQYDKSGQLLRDADGLPMYGGLEKAPDLQTLDYIKRGLDDVIGTGSQKSLGRTEIGALKKARSEFVNRIDEIGPDEYKAARQTFAGYSNTKEALESGRNIFNMPENDWRELADQFAKMTPLEQQMFRRGVVDASRIRLDQAANEIGSAPDVSRVFAKKSTLNRLREVFPEGESFDAFKSNLEREAQMGQTRNSITAGSRTTPLAEDIADTGAPGLPSASEAISAAHGNFFPAIAGVTNRLIGGRLQGVTGDTAEVLGDKLLGLNTPQAIGSYMDELVRRKAMIEAEAAARADNRGLLSYGLSDVAGGAMGVQAPQSLLFPQQ